MLRVRDGSHAVSVGRADGCCVVRLAEPKSKDGERDREFAVNGVSDRTLVYRAYEIAAMAGASAGIDRFVLEGLLGHGTGPLIASMVDKGQLVEVGNGTRLLAGRAPTHS